MKACPKCQTKNQDSNNFCKKCGFQLSGSSFQDKKEKVLGERRRKTLLGTDFPCRRCHCSWQELVTGSSRGIQRADPKVSSQPKVSEKVDYSGQTIRMTDIQAKVEKGKILSLSMW